MKVDMKFTGGMQIERALAELARGTAKGVGRRALKKELQPVADLANVFWPGSDDRVFKVGSRLTPTQRSGGGRVGRSVINMYVGAPGGANGTPEAHLLEFGTGPRFQTKTGRYTGSVAPTPMLQPAWEAFKPQMLRGLANTLRAEIQKTVARINARAGR